MPDFLQLFATLREQMNAELTRTDALRPLVWPIAGLLIALSVAVTAHADKWLLITISSIMGLLVAAYIFGYAYFAVKNPDALRSEKNQLHKMAIEHGLLGDSTMGLKKLEDSPPVKIVAAEPAKSLSHD